MDQKREQAIDIMTENRPLTYKASKYAILCHESVNQRYGKEKAPYAVHLAAVVSNVDDWMQSHPGLVPKEQRGNVIAAAWCHDLIEDTRETYNDVKKNTNQVVADIVYALTNEKGKTRAERANDKYYEGIRNTPYAVLVKLADRMANAKYSKQIKSPMFEKYQAEHEHFRQQLYTPDTSIMYSFIWDALDILFYY